VEAVLQGKNGTVFCYGATGAGKTYTMLGTMESPGVMVLAIKDLFSKIRTRSCDGNHVVHLSYLEVYNETVRDLISPGRPLVLREDKKVHFHILIVFYLFIENAMVKSKADDNSCLLLSDMLW
jgi:kinesin family protein 18/19